MNNKEEIELKIKEGIEDIDNLSSNFKKRVTLSQTQVAQILGISDNTVSNLRKKGTGPEFIKVGGRILYSKRSIAEYIINSKIKTF